MNYKCFIFTIMTILALNSTNVSTVMGQPYDPDTCRQGYVWREAFPGDHVCVTGETRAQAAYDNSQAAARREPSGGEYGPDTCRQGYVWREADPDDHVCVTGETRAQTAYDNSQADARRAPIVIVEGNLYRESAAVAAGLDEAYLIQQGKRVRIPTADALIAMGYDESQVIIVPDGALSSYPQFDIPSSSQTPGSLIFPPNSTKKHFPLKGISTAVTIFSQGREIQLVELYGWLKGVADKCNTEEDEGADFHYYLEIDTEWAIAQGIDLNRILRVGNLIPEGNLLPGFSPRRAVGLPLITIELNSWGWRNSFPPGNKIPKDWKGVEPNCEKSVVWPFDPYLGGTLSAIDKFSNQRGPYVRIAGSLITDSPHDKEAQFWSLLSRVTGITRNLDDEWRGAVPDWSPGVSTDNPEHYARWTEIHPPDLIEVIDLDRQPTVTTRSVALAARVAGTIGPVIPSCEEVEFDIFPEAARPSGWRIAYQELRGPETYFPWGQDLDNGSWITPYYDHIHVKAKVCGGSLGGSPGRFKAIYRVWWKPPPPTPTPYEQCIQACIDSRNLCMDSVGSPGGTRPGECIGEYRACRQECAR